MTWNLDMVMETVLLQTECKCGNKIQTWIRKDDDGEKIIKILGGKLNKDNPPELGEDVELSDNEFMCDSCYSILSIEEVEEEEEEESEEEETETESVGQTVTNQTEESLKEKLKDVVHRPTGWAFKKP